MVITTNATTLTDRSKALIEDLHCELNISIDSVVPETFERIRQNAGYDQVMENLNYFIDYSARKNYQLGMSVCPMQQNWREMAQIVEFCNRHGIAVGFNTVYWPKHCSLRTLEVDSLNRVVETWGAYDLPENTWLERQNRHRLMGALQQINQWRDEAREHKQKRDPFEALVVQFERRVEASGALELGDDLGEGLSRLLLADKECERELNEARTSIRDQYDDLRDAAGNEPLHVAFVSNDLEEH